MSNATYPPMSDTTYPRDLVGYGANPPAVRWPGDAAIVVSLVLNYEEGGENCVLHGDAASEAVLTDVGADAVQGARNLNVESIFEYGSRVGFWEVFRLIQSRHLSATVFAVGMALERNPEAAAALSLSDWEVACHGQRWIDYQGVAEDLERDHVQRNVEVITRLIGRPPVAGTRAGPARIPGAWWWSRADLFMTAMPTAMICLSGHG